MAEFRPRNEPCTDKRNRSGSYSIDKKTPNGWRQVQCFETREKRDNVLSMLRGNLKGRNANNSDRPTV